MKIIKSATSEISRSSEAEKKKEEIEKKKKGKKKTKLLLRFADKKLQCARNAAKNSRYCDLYLEILFSVSVRLARQTSQISNFSIERKVTYYNTPFIENSPKKVSFIPNCQEYLLKTTRGNHAVTTIRFSQNYTFKKEGNETLNQRLLLRI